jgi:selenocysteine lyase/cysteine desulfurase
VVGRARAPGPVAYLDVEHHANLLPWQARRPDLAAVAHRHGARLAVDGAQLVPHRAVDMGSTGVDYLAFPGHKIYAPFGAGVLAGRRDWLDAAPPHLAGGGAVREVTATTVTRAGSPRSVPPCTPSGPMTSTRLAS